MDAVVDSVMAAMPTSCDGAGVSAVVAAGREVCGEEVRVEMRSQPPGRYGMCARTPDGHIIYVDPDLPGDLREHTVLHELGHVLLGHHDTAHSAHDDRLLSLLMGGDAQQTCVVPHFREWAQREADAERFAATVSRRLRRGMTTQRQSRLDEAFG
ncbi:ImmA/IrrE family metallo-endopeptidase [Dietzia sp. 179-F 9C3 NHS]|uniref:ImmA/IrrE family metallo-endopeptidase n=1 Tax=Dietzia sp. 179-F 9C3 NHS TaxID=3374295 RepID=UPI0038797E43